MRFGLFFLVFATAAGELWLYSHRVLEEVRPPVSLPVNLDLNGVNAADFFVRQPKDYYVTMTWPRASAGRVFLPETAYKTKVTIRCEGRIVGEARRGLSYNSEEVEVQIGKVRAYPNKRYTLEVDVPPAKEDSNLTVRVDVAPSVGLQRRALYRSRESRSWVEPLLIMGVLLEAVLWRERRRQPGRSVRP